MKDLAQDMAEDVLGAAKDGSVKVFIVVTPPTLPLGDRSPVNLQLLVDK